MKTFLARHIHGETLLFVLEGRERQLIHSRAELDMAFYILKEIGLTDDQARSVARDGFADVIKRLMAMSDEWSVSEKDILDSIRIVKMR